jgi:tetratricopeptide (TPR) repeat protein
VIPSAAPGVVQEKSRVLAGADDLLNASKEVAEGGDLGLALDLLKEACRRFERDPKTHLAYGKLLLESARGAASVLEKGDFFYAARLAAERAKECDPGIGSPHLLLGQISVMTAFRNGDDPKKGEELVRHALALGLDAKEQAMAQFLLGLGQRTRGNEAAARSLFEKAVALDPLLFPARLAVMA